LPERTLVARQVIKPKNELPEKERRKENKERVASKSADKVATKNSPDRTRGAATGTVESGHLMKGARGNREPQGRRVAQNRDSGGERDKKKQKSEYESRTNAHGRYSLLCYKTRRCAGRSSSALIDELLHVRDVGANRVAALREERFFFERHIERNDLLDAAVAENDRNADVITAD
jgi:hypothetical protein